MNRAISGEKISKMPVYWRFLATYMCITCIIIIMLIPLYNKASSISKQSYLEEVKYSLARSTESMENTVEAVKKIPYFMKQSLYYTKMKFFQEEKLTGEYYVYFRRPQTGLYRSLKRKGSKKRTPK